MSQPKKFGTFGGVFTPSILTILGVIMYMRLSWVIGSSGSLITAILIILMAHVVSLTTGLSVSSVATDKKIKAGGIYYMLSRSLGLPIGGSIGITLFIATALSIALYLIGFAESALVVLKNPLGIEEITTNHLRVVGSIALLVIVTIAFISTSIAIKSQYFILGAIVLSLVSIFMGTTDGKSFDLSNVDQGNINFSVLFGIFFPAVTGFTAGVAMSGDLRNPKKSIPWGTMLAVFTGLIVYVGLAIFIYYSIDNNILISDKNALTKFGWIPNLVIAGIWGATLSSALGGILGAPRILQAMSVDGITPKVFEKGFGEDNEPRNALILTFVLAEIGVLIGELDVIAEVVAMFYMSAYLFINVSCLLEQWASPDFRPTFKIPLGTPLLGAIVTFLLMIQLNLAAALGAILIMLILFIWLSRKQLALGSGDVWLSVWSSMVKLGLKKLDKKSTHKRNWEPNILLFSGGGSNREKLLQFSKSVAGRSGVISNFDLIENTTAKILFPKHKQSLKDDKLFSQGIFSRKQECKDSYLGIETIASTYGFSGVEPNTILLGWEKSSADPIRFSQLTQKLSDLDYNVLYLDYDKERGFGDKKQIDIWWVDFSNITELTLSLVKFLNRSSDWRAAEIRILHICNEQENKGGIEKRIKELIDSYRIKAIIKVINNEIQNKPLYEVMKIESYDADLILVGMPNQLDNEEEFVDKTNELVNVLGTTLLLKASSHFEGLDVSFEKDISKEERTKVDGLKKPFTILPIYKSHFAHNELNNLTKFNKRVFTRLKVNSLDSIFNNYDTIISNLKSKIDVTSEDFNRLFSVSSNANNIDLLRKKHLTFLIQVISEIKNYNSLSVNEIENNLAKEIKSFERRFGSYINQLPTNITRELTPNEIVINEKDKFWDKSLKKWLLIKSKLGLAPKINIPYRSIVKFNYENVFIAEVNLTLKKLNLLVLKLSNELNLYIADFGLLYDELGKTNKISKQGHEIVILSLQEKIKELSEKWKAMYNDYFKLYTQLNVSFVELIRENIDTLRIKNILENKLESTSKSDFKNQTKLLQNFSKAFLKNNILINNQVLLECSLNKIHPELDRVHYEVCSNINMFNINPEINRIKEVETLCNNKDINSGDLKIALITYLNRLSEISIDNEELIDNTIKKVEKIVYKIDASLEVMSSESINNFITASSNVNTVRIQLQKLMLFAIQNKFVATINKESEKLEEQINDFIYDYKSKSKLIEIVNFEDKEESQKIEKIILEEGLALVDKIETRYYNFVSKLSNELEETYKILDFEFIRSNIKIIDGYIKHSRGSSKSNLISKKVNKFIDNIKKAYGKSLNYIEEQRDDYLIKDFQHKNQKTYNSSSLILKFIQSLTNTKLVNDSIPFFYKKIFVANHAAPFKIENRDLEIKEALTAVDLLLKNGGGAILILGEKLSGKKYFSDYIASRIIKRAHITITPVISNKSILDCFNESIKKVINSDLSLVDYLDNIESATFVFDNIEKWMVDISVMNELKRIMELFNDKHIFILNGSTISYSFVSRFVNFENIVSSTILIRPIKKNSFIETLKIKHQAGGIKLVLKGKQERNISVKKMNALFQKYHTISNGNIGLASLMWINNIIGYKNEKIYIKEPLYVYFPDITSNDWIIVLKLFVLYGELSEFELTNVFKKDIEFKKIINQMMRVGLLNKPQKRVYEIIPEAVHYIEGYLKEKKIIE